MGFKLSILVTPLGERSLESIIKSLYGKKAYLEPCSEIVENAFYPENTEIPYACVEGGNAWFFD